MASPGQLVKVTAEVLGIPEPTVVLADRFLSEAGLRSKSGRGRGAAKVTVDDAANLLIALTGSPLPKDAVENVENYAGLPLSDLRSDHRRAETWLLPSFPVTHLQALKPNHTFHDAVSAFIRAASDGSLSAAIAAIPPLGVEGHDVSRRPILDISLYGPAPSAAIRLSGAGFIEEARYAVKHAAIDDILKWHQIHGGGDLRRSAEFGFATINALGAMLAPR